MGQKLGSNSCYDFLFPHLEKLKVFSLIILSMIYTAIKNTDGFEMTDLYGDVSIFLSELLTE